MLTVRLWVSKWILLLTYLQEELQTWLAYQKKKWAFQAAQRQKRRKRRRMELSDLAGGSSSSTGTGGVYGAGSVSGIGGFLRRTAQTLLDAPWQIVEIAETGDPGVYRLWAVIGADLHAIKLIVPHIFYVNQKTPKDGEGACMTQFGSLGFTVCTFRNHRNPLYMH